MVTRVTGEKMIFGGRILKPFFDEFSAQSHRDGRTFQLGRKKEQSIFIRDYDEGAFFWRSDDKSVKVSVDGRVEQEALGRVEGTEPTLRARVEGGGEIFAVWYPRSNGER